MQPDSILKIANTVASLENEDPEECSDCITHNLVKFFFIFCISVRFYICTYSAYDSFFSNSTFRWPDSKKTSSNNSLYSDSSYYQSVLPEGTYDESVYTFP